MNYHDYLDYRCIAQHKLVERSGIPRHKLRYKTCPNNLTYKEVALLKAIIGDWDSYEPTDIDAMRESLSHD